MALSLELNIIILGFLILLSGFFSSVELAIFSISKVKTRKMVADRRRNAELLAELKKKPQDLLTTILIGNNLVNVAAASLATAVSLGIFPGDIGIAFATGIITLAILIFGEITPKSLALKHNEFIALNSAPVLKFLSVVFSPLVFVLGRITGFFTAFFGGDERGASLTEEEVMTVVSLGAEEGAIRKEEKEMIRRIFKLNDLIVEDVMTPRAEIAAIESGTKIIAVDKKLMQQHSRIPVYRHDLDEVIGIFYIRDIIGKKPGPGSVTVDKIMRKPVYVYANKRIDRLLREFQRKKTHMAIVVNEYGSTIGLITIEDILEEIVGEIIDETDEEYVIKKIRENEFLVQGPVPLNELSRTLKTGFSSEDYDTVAGYVIGAMDRVPKEKDEVVISNVRFRVEKMDGPKIELVRVFK